MIPSRFAPALAALLVSSLGAPAALAQQVQVQLTGNEEVPPNHSTATGSGRIAVDADGNVTGTISASLKEGRLCHIHLGAPGQSGPPIITLGGGDPGTWTVPDGAKLTPDQLLSWKAGNLYVNCHTADFPGGEIRAQLRP